MKNENYSEENIYNLASPNYLKSILNIFGIETKDINNSRILEIRNLYGGGGTSKYIDILSQL